MGKFDLSLCERFAVFCGIDVGKTKHHAVALAADGRRLLDCAVDNDKQQLRAVFAEFSAQGVALVVVDQVSGIGALPIAVARDFGLDVAYLPGLTMRRLADVHPGRDKTDPRDAYVIADAARTLPHTLRSVNAGEGVRVSLGILAGYDNDLTAESTRLTNRLHQALLHIHPAPERVLGPKIRNRSVQELLATAPTPDALEPV